MEFHATPSRPSSAIRSIACLCAIALVALIHVNAADAVEGEITSTPLEQSTTIPSSQLVDLITLPPRHLEAGESIFLQGRLEATSNTTANVAQEVGIGCLGAAGTEAEVLSSRNHEGYDAPYANPGHLPVLVDYLFTAPSTGDYECRLIGRAWSVDPDYALTAVPGMTRIHVSDEVQPGAHSWTNKACNPSGTTGTCVYIGGGNPDSFSVFYDDFSPRYVWTADPAASRVEARADVQLTTCYANTGSCVDSVDQHGTFASSVVETTLQLIQLDETRHACHTFNSPTKRTTIHNAAHHYAIGMIVQPVSLDPACTREFILRVNVERVSGNPVKIDGYDDRGFRQTTGIAFNRFS